MRPSPNKIAILGSGSWGLTLACLMASDKRQVTLWGRDAQKIEAFQRSRHVAFPLELTLPESLELTASLEEAIIDADVVLFVVTSKATRDVLQAIKALACLKPDAVLINASKGLEFPSLRRMSQVIAEECPHHEQAVLSGPTLAKELLDGLPTASTIACSNAETAEWLQQSLTCDQRFRLYSNTDVIGVELGGALKNVFAIASGYMAAHELGDNSKAALITRGLAELARFSVSQGAQEQTAFGLSGLGDLLATCYSPLSRNYQVGYRIGKGQSIEAILADMRVAAEGIHTARAVQQVARKLELDTPVVDLVVHTLDGHRVTPQRLIKGLMSRRLKSEQLVAMAR